VEATTALQGRELPLLQAGWTGAGFSGSPGVPSLVSGFRTPNLLLLPVWEKGGGGDEGRKRAGMQNIAYLS